MSKYHNDQPIYGGQNDPDLLNRLSFANYLADILLLDHTDECLTVSLESEWGYGKTSVINLVKGALNEKETFPIVIEYNPWLAGNPESLIQDFLLQFSSQLNIKNNTEVAVNASRELIAYSNLFSIAKLVPGAEPWASIIENLLAKTGRAVEGFSELQKIDLLGKKKEVSDAIRKIGIPIVVFIDDIDRLTPAEAFQILRLVKAVADFSGTSFLLAFDSNYLVSVLDKNGIENASEYINKIVQLRVSLPVISETGMNDLANVELENLSDKDLTDQFRNDQERLSWIYYNYFRHLIKNPRELKRFFNHLKFIVEQIGGQVCFADLFALSLITTKSNLLYEHIKATPEAYIGKGFSNNLKIMEKPKDVVESYSEIRSEILKNNIKKDRDLLKGLLGDIFPLVASNGYSHYAASDPDAEGRVADSKRLHVAFHYTTPYGYISDSDINDFISGNINRHDFICNVINDDADERFFEMMMFYSNRCKNESYEVLISIYDGFLFSDKLISSRLGNYSFTSNDIYQKINWITEKIIADSDDKYELIRGIVSRKNSIPISTYIIYTVRGQQNDMLNKNSWVTIEQFDELEQIFQTVAIEALTERTFIDNDFESQIFYELQRVSYDKSADFINEILSTENGVIRVAEIINRSGRDSVNGRYVQVDNSSLGEKVDFVSIQNSVKEMDISSQPIHIQAVLKSILDGKKYYLKDGSLGESW
ncbi:TPA: P-loop NTPase fold protein [Providencia rettgeri]